MIFSSGLRGEQPLQFSLLPCPELRVNFCGCFAILHVGRQADASFTEPTSLAVVWFDAVSASWWKIEGVLESKKKAIVFQFKNKINKEANGTLPVVVGRLIELPV